VLAISASPFQQRSIGAVSEPNLSALAHGSSSDADFDRDDGDGFRDSAPSVRPLLNPPRYRPRTASGTFEGCDEGVAAARADPFDAALMACRGGRVGEGEGDGDDGGGQCSGGSDDGGSGLMAWRVTPCHPPPSWSTYTLPLAVASEPFAAAASEASVAGPVPASGATGPAAVPLAALRALLPIFGSDDDATVAQLERAARSGLEGCAGQGYGQGQGDDGRGTGEGGDEGGGEGCGKDPSTGRRVLSSRVAGPLAAHRYPLDTLGDGNCLLHGVSLGLWGVHDRPATPAPATPATATALAPGGAPSAGLSWAASLLPPSSSSFSVGHDAAAPFVPRPGQLRSLLFDLMQCPDFERRAAPRFAYEIRKADTQQVRIIT